MTKNLPEWAAPVAVIAGLGALAIVSNAVLFKRSSPRSETSGGLKRPRYLVVGGAYGMPPMTADTFEEAAEILRKDRRQGLRGWDSGIIDREDGNKLIG